MVGVAVLKEYAPGVEKGLKLAKESGVGGGFPMIDVKAILIDAAYHDVDSNVMTFDIAARGCFREAIPQAGLKLRGRQRPLLAQIGHLAFRANCCRFSLALASATEGVIGIYDACVALWGQAPVDKPGCL